MRVSIGWHQCACTGCFEECLHLMLARSEHKIGLWRHDVFLKTDMDTVFKSSKNDIQCAFMQNATIKRKKYSNRDEQNKATTHSFYLCTAVCVLYAHTLVCLC